MSCTDCTHRQVSCLHCRCHCMDRQFGVLYLGCTMHDEHRCLGRARMASTCTQSTIRLIGCACLQRNCGALGAGAGVLLCTMPMHGTTHSGPPDTQAARTAAGAHAHAHANGRGDAAAAAYAAAAGAGLERQAQDIAAQIWDLESRLAMLRDQARSDLEAPRCWLGSVYST